MDASTLSGSHLNIHWAALLHSGSFSTGYCSPVAQYQSPSEPEDVRVPPTSPILAKFAARAAARLVDLLIVNIAWIAGAAANTFWLIIASFGAVIWEFGWLATRSATPGKLLMDTKVVGKDFEPLSGGKAALRSLDLAVLAAISAISVGASGYARLYFVTSLVFIAVDTAERRSIMDHIAGTRVIQAD